jgi:hypothetical protein
VKRLARVVVVAVTLTALSAGVASAQEGAPGFELKENPALVKADGPGFQVKLSKHDVRVRIDDERFGIPEAGFSIERRQIDLGPLGSGLRPFVCENGTYRIVSGIFEVTERIEHRATTASLHAGLCQGLSGDHHVRRHARRRRDQRER